MAIKQIAFFGDSYCYDSNQNPKSRCHGTGEETYIDLLSYPTVHFGTSGHGPNWAMHELDKNKQPILEKALPIFESILIKAAIKKTNGKKHEAAKLLGWGSNTLTRKIKELKLTTKKQL